MTISFAHHLLPISIAVLAGVAAALYTLAFFRSKPRVLLYLVMAIVSIYMSAIYALVTIGAVADLNQLSELVRPALPPLFACIIAERLRNAAH